MKLKALLAVALFSCPTVALAEDPIYVIRPHVPGVAAGVLPQDAFSVDAGTPGQPNQPEEGSGLPYHYVSVRYNAELGKVPGTTATVKLGDSYTFKPFVEQSPNTYCSIWIPEDFDTRSWFYEWRQSDGGLRLEFPKADKYGMSNWRNTLGIFAFYIDCQARDENYDVFDRQFQTLTITTSK